MKEVLAIVGAGLAAVVTRAAFHFLAQDLTYGVYADPKWIRVVIAVAFFAVLVALDREILKVNARGDSATKQGDAGSVPEDTPARMAYLFSGVTDEASRQQAMREWLAGIPKCSVLVPFIFYLRFGWIGPIGWGLTVFFDVYCLLWVVGLYFLPRTEYHTPVRLRGDWLDRVGAFWLVGCAFGPLFGWIVTEALPVTPGSWHWLYGLRAFLAAGVPILLALPLLRYIRGKSVLVALPLLIIITSLSVSSATSVIQDLWEGTGVTQVQTTGHTAYYLKHTGRSLGDVP